MEVYDSPSSVLAKYLIDTLGGFTDPSDNGDWPLFTTVMPDALGVAFECATLIDDQPQVDSKTMDGKYCKANGLKIQVRSSSYETGYRKLAGVVPALALIHGAQVVIVGSYTYAIVNIHVVTDVKYIGVDEKQRHHFVSELLVKLNIV